MVVIRRTDRLDARPIALCENEVTSVVSLFGMLLRATEIEVYLDSD